MSMITYNSGCCHIKPGWSSGRESNRQGTILVLQKQGFVFLLCQVCVCHLVTLPSPVSTMKNANFLLPSLTEELPG